MQHLINILKHDKERIIEEWVKEAKGTLENLDKMEIKLQSKKLFDQIGNVIEDLVTQESVPRERLDDILHNVVIQWSKFAVSPKDLSDYFIALYSILFEVIKKEEVDYKDYVDDISRIAVFISSVAIFSYDVFVREKEKIIATHENAIKELEIPILRLNRETILVPMIGLIDSQKSMNLIKKVLSSIRSLEVRNVVLDVEGVPVIDTDIANQLIKLERAVRLMGSRLVISGFTPTVAETMSHLDVSLDIPTTSVLEDAINSFER